MPERKACERRVYRLALLLTGDRHRAASVIDRVLESQPDLTRLDSSRMDRLTVLRCREAGGSTWRVEGFDEELSSALGALPDQQREAWVFCRVYKLPVRETSRAMDCSTTAAEHHLVQADAAMERRFGKQAAKAAVRLRRQVATVRVPRFYYRHKRRRLIYRKVVVPAVIAGVVAAALWIGWHAWQDVIVDLADDRQEEVESAAPP